MKYILLRWWLKWCLKRNYWHRKELDHIVHQEYKRLDDSDRQLVKRLGELSALESQAIIQASIGRA